MQTEQYTVRLSMFEGPLDLLLYLIRRAELDVTLISIAEITEQYLSFLQHVETIDVETAGEFLLTAATLVEIKSRLVMPPEDAGGASNDGEDRGPEQESADPGMELVRQLLRYKKYRDAADALEDSRASWEKKYPVSAPGIERDALREAMRAAEDVELDDLQLFDLVEAFQRILETVQLDRIGDHTVSYDDTPIEEHEADIMDRLRNSAVAMPGGGHGLCFHLLFEGRERGSMIGLFLALLELVKQRQASVKQDEINGEIWLFAATDADAGTVPIAGHDQPIAARAPAAWDDDHIFDDEEIDDDEDEKAPLSVPD